jgi:hypothetical protein
MSCEYYTLEVHALCNFASSLHSIEHLNHEVCRQHIYAPPSQKPAEKLLFKSLQKGIYLQLPIKGNELSRILVLLIQPCIVFAKMI